MTQHLPEPFNYQALDTPTREFLQQKADEIHGQMKRTAEGILQIGQSLCEVKARLPHGQFLAWIRSEFEMSYHSALNFIHVAQRFGGKSRNFLNLPVSVLYALARPSTSDALIEQIESGQLPPELEGIKQAREAERQAKLIAEQSAKEREVVQQQLYQARVSLEAEIERLNLHIVSLQQQMATLTIPQMQIKEVQVEIPVIPPEVTTQLENLQQQVKELTQQRSELVKQNERLGEQNRAAAFEQWEGEDEYAIHRNWYMITHNIRSCIQSALAKWPSPLDARMFGAKEWTRFSQTKDLVHRLLREYEALSNVVVVDGNVESCDI